MVTPATVLTSIIEPVLGRVSLVVVHAKNFYNIVSFLWSTQKKIDTLDNSKRGVQLVKSASGIDFRLVGVSSVIGSMATKGVKNRFY